MKTDEKPACWGTFTRNGTLVSGNDTHVHTSAMNRTTPMPDEYDSNMQLINYYSHKSTPISKSMNHQSAEKWRKGKKLFRTTDKTTTRKKAPRF